MRALLWADSTLKWKVAMKKQLKVVYSVKHLTAPQLEMLRCRVHIVTLASGETLKRGCGRRGLVEFGAGWRCFYCGNYLYKENPPLRALWFHFRLARDYWRVKNFQGRDFVNGIPVTGAGEPLPHSLLKDLAEPEPPEWFEPYLSFNEEEFQTYIGKLPREEREAE